MLVQNPPPSLNSERTKKKHFSQDLHDLVAICLQKVLHSSCTGPSLLRISTHSDSHLSGYPLWQSPVMVQLCLSSESGCFYVTSLFCLQGLVLYFTSSVFKSPVAILKPCCQLVGPCEATKSTGFAGASLLSTCQGEGVHEEAPAQGAAECD